MIISQCRSNYIYIYNLHSPLYLLTAFIKYLTVLLEYLYLFENYVGGKACKHLGGPGPCQACLLTMPLFENNVSRVSHVSTILIFDYFYACAWFIILKLFLSKL